MQMVKKSFFALLVLWLAILFFMPKQELYYTLETQLAKNGIKINEKSIEAGMFSLTLHESSVYVKDIKLANVERVEFFTLLFYTHVEVTNLVLDESLKSVVPTKIEEVSLTHQTWNPLQINVKAQGSFGAMQGNIAFIDRTLRFDFNETQNIAMLKPKLKEDEKGWYYETSF